MDLTNYTATPVSVVAARLQEARHNAALLVKAQIETIQNITNGGSLLTDATTPFILQLEMTAAAASNCIQESIATLRNQYAALAETPDQLYRHMTDGDFIDRFASPARTKLTFAFLLTDVKNNGVRDASESCIKLIIPRDTKIEVDGYVFSILYPVVVRYYDNGVFRVSYDGSIMNPVYALANTIINIEVRQSSSSKEQWITFDLDVLQVDISAQFAPIGKAYAFEKKYVFVDNFFYARAFFRNAATGNQWAEMRTTHTDQVFDASKPTLCMQVLDQELKVTIPVIYTSSGLVSGEIRVDIYTTKGEMTLNLQNYRQDNFQITMRAIDTARDLNTFTTAMSGVSFYAMSRDIVTGGKKALTFEELRKLVIYDGLGTREIPITNVEVVAEGATDGFVIVKNVDMLTNRVFLATRELPIPSEKKLITPANIGIATYITKAEEILNHPSVKVNGNRSTIISKTLWENRNGIVSLLTQVQLSALNAQGQSAFVNTINLSKYLYTPFYYVLDESGEEFDLRAYKLDQPYAKDQNFSSQNETLNLFVSTGSYQLEKTTAGFRLTILTSSGNFYKQVENGVVGAQLAFYPKGQTTRAYINGVHDGANTDGERRFVFDIETNHDLDNGDLLCITNARVNGIAEMISWVDLETKFDLLHWTTSLTPTYTADASDHILGKFILPSAAAGNTHERLTLHFGDALGILWRRSRSYFTDRAYQTYPNDVPLLYEADVFDVDPNNNSPFTVDGGVLTWNYLHHVGDPVLDSNGDPVMKYRAGDTVLDEQGLATYSPVSIISREIDILVVDARYFFANDSVSTKYRTEIEGTLGDWITDTLPDLRKRLLEKTELFYYPKTALGTIEVYIEDNEKIYLDAEQTLAASLYVDYATYNNSELRENLRVKTIKVLDEYIGKEVINMTGIRSALELTYGSSVSAFDISGLGGNLNLQYVRLLSGKNKLCLKKELVIQADKSMVVEDRVEIEFKVVW